MRSLLALTLLLVNIVLTPSLLAQDIDPQIGGVLVDAARYPQVGRRIELRLPAGSQVIHGDGEIHGIVVDVSGRGLADQRLELRGPATKSGVLLERTDTRGQFSFKNLPYGSHRLDWVVDGRVVQSRGPFVLGEAVERVNNLVFVDQPSVVPREPIAEHHYAVTVNPFLSLAQFFNAEYERRRTVRTTWGVSGTLREVDDFGYRTLKGLFRAYPMGIAMHGPFVGLRAGVSRVSDRFDDSGRYFVAGPEFGYTSFSRGDQHFVLSVGVGVTRLFGVHNFQALRRVVGPSRTRPVLRLNMGVAF